MVLKWANEEEAYLLVCIDRNLKRGAKWDDDLVAKMKEGNNHYDRTLRAFSMRAESLAKKFGSDKDQLHEQGLESLRLVPEMRTAVAAAKKMYVLPPQ
jgi:hypothetical protein